MPKELKEVEEEVVELCGFVGVTNFITFLETEPLTLWAREEPEGFLTDMVVLALYKLIDGRGYQAILRDLNLPFKMNHKSYHTNCLCIWRKGEQWAESKVVLGGGDGTGIKQLKILQGIKNSSP